MQAASVRALADALGAQNIGRVDVSEPASISTGIAARYATAIFELSKEGNALPALEGDVDALDAALTDSADFRSLIASPVYSREDQAKGVTAGADALAYLEGAPCDVVLLDVKMPGIGGLEVIKRIKEQQPSLEVVLLTGHSSAQDAERGMTLGAFDYLMKPVKIDDLLRVLLSAGARTGKGAPGES